MASAYPFPDALLPAVEQLGADAQLLRSGLRAAVFRRQAQASALKASLYWRRLSGDGPLFFAVITEGRYVLLLSG
ncbi:hypothetical protein [Hymenobacter sp. BT730]|uniref:hypothetical protein n=1 Tax=Hymenobacter sp. BT730 TaxID=3063332 RepID=UPI0026DFBCCD|nr:hypothetical protein [Hymenobacter sp. BT730]